MWWIGSIPSLIVHSIVFATAFLLPVFGIVSVDKMLLVLTTVLSLEAIYLAIFIQMSVNRSQEHIEDIREDIEEIQDDIEEISEDIEEISEDIDDIQEDIEDIAEDEDDEDHSERAKNVMLKSNVSSNKSDIKALREMISNLQQQLAATTEGMRKVVTNVEQVNAERAGNAQRAFHAELGRICPEWQQIDNMPDFHNWLDQRKPMSVRTYRQDAEEAWGAGDAVAVAECYNAFKSDFLSNQGQRQNGQQQGNVQNPGSQQPHNNQQPPDGSWQQGQGQQQGQQNQQQVQQGQQGNSGQQQQIVQQGQQGNPQSQQQTFMQFDEFGQPIYIGPQVNQQVQQGQQLQQGNHGGQQQGQNYQQGQLHNPLEYMVEPSPMAGNPPQAPQQKRIYTIQEITDHNTRMTKNPRLLQDPTWAAMEKDMANAVLEGRVAGQLPDMRLQSGEARFVQGI